MKNKLHLWWLRNFCVIDNLQAKRLGLRHKRNTYGDEINRLNCRSIWMDKYFNEYRVKFIEEPFSEIKVLDCSVSKEFENFNKSIEEATIEASKSLMIPKEHFNNDSI